MARTRRKALFDRSTARILLASVGLAVLVALLRIAIPLAPPRPEGLTILDPGRGEPTLRVLLDVFSDGALPLNGPARLIDGAGVTQPLRGELTAREGMLKLRGRPLEMPVEIRPTQGSLVWRSQRYPGHLVIHRQAARILVVNHVLLEAYVEGVVLEEMGANAPLQALMSQAIASRSYALDRASQRKSRLYDLKDDQSSQVYRGLPGHRARAHEAVAGTEAVVISFHGRVLQALYSSTCGGWTRPASEVFGSRAAAPLNHSVPCDFCSHSPTYRWEHGIALATLRRRLSLPPGPLVIARIVRFNSGRARQIDVLVNGQTLQIPISRLRRAMGSRMRSSWISEARIRNGRLVLEGRGFGHGVGLCQYGARGQARQGRDWASIVLHYYPGAELALAWSPIPGT